MKSATSDYKAQISDPGISPHGATADAGFQFADLRSPTRDSEISNPKSEIPARSGSRITDFQFLDQAQITACGELRGRLR